MPIRAWDAGRNGIRCAVRLPVRGSTSDARIGTRRARQPRSPTHDDGAGPEGPAPWRRVEGVRCGYCCPGSLRLSQRSFMRSMKEPPEEDGRDGRPADCPFARGAFAPDFDIRIPGRSA